MAHSTQRDAVRCVVSKLNVSRVWFHVMHMKLEFDSTAPTTLVSDPDG